MAIDMRHTKLNAEEAAILAGEVEKPSYVSRNEGIHERVSFEDTIWGFDLAGGSYYKTPLRVTYVKAGSRAEKAGIRPGDRLKRINDIDTSTLTIQEAHEIIIESGVHLKIAVTAPEDEEDAYYCYEDPLNENGYDSDEERRKEEERARKRQVHARVSHYWSLQWPWVSKRRIIYRESNCFMVPSKFEEKNKSKFPTQPMLRTQEDIVLESMKSELEKKKNVSSNPTVNGNTNIDEHNKTNLPILKYFDNKVSAVNGNENLVLNGNKNKQNIPDIEEPSVEEESNTIQEEVTEEISQSEELTESIEDNLSNEVSVDESHVGTLSEKESRNTETMDTNDDADVSQEDIETEDNTETNDDVDKSQEEDPDEVIEQMLEGDESVSKTEEENIIESILSESEDQIVSTSDER